MSQFGFSALPSERAAVQKDGSDLNGQEVNSATSFDTNEINPGGARRVGLFVNIASEDSSSGTLDIDLEYSPDKGTTWVDLPQGNDTETVAELAQFTATGSKFRWFELCAEAQFSRLRGEFTQAGLTASEGFTYGPCYWILADVD